MDAERTMLVGSDRLPDNRDALVLVVAGERDVHAAWLVGAVAVAQAVGASADPECADWSVLAGRPVLVVAARDEPGRQRARVVAEHIVNIAARVTIGEAVDGKDLSDHVAAGHDIGDLIFVDELYPARRLVLTRASEIADAAPRWMWRYGGEGRISNGSLVLAVGRPGIGKSSFACRLAAEVSNGCLEGDFYGIERAVIVCAAESSWRYTLVPRFRASGANLDNVYRVEVFNAQGRPGHFCPEVDPVELARLAEQVDAALIVIDPILSITDLDPDDESHGLLEPYALMAERLGAVVLGICHVNNTGNRDVATVISELSTRGELVRATFGFFEDNSSGYSTRTMVQAKNAHGRDNLALAYEISDIDITTSTGQRARVARFVIADESTGTAEKALRDGHLSSGAGSRVAVQSPGCGPREGTRPDRANTAVHSGRSHIHDARTWLEDHLKEQGVVKSAEVKRAAASHGYSRSSIDRAARKLKVVSIAEGFPRITYWKLPDQHADMTGAPFAGHTISDSCTIR